MSPSHPEPVGSSTADAGQEQLRHALIAEAHRIALREPAPARDRLLVDVARLAARHLDPRETAAIADAIVDPAWRITALSALLQASAPADAAGAHRSMLAAAASIAGGSAAPAGERAMATAVAALALHGEMDAAERLHRRAPTAAVAEPLVGALLAASRREDALANVLLLPDDAARDDLLEAVSDAFAESDDADRALAVADRIGDPFAREAQRLAVAFERSGMPRDLEGAAVMGDVRGRISFLLALRAHAYQCLRTDDDAGARAFATAALRVADTGFTGRERDRALELAAAVGRDVDGAEDDGHETEPDDMTMRDAAIDQLRRGDLAGAAATLEAVADGREWATWSLGGLAARYGQAERLWEWAQRYLASGLQVNALLGAAAYLGDPPPHTGPAAFVFPPIRL